MEAQRMSDEIIEFVTPAGGIVVYELACALPAPLELRIDHIRASFPPQGYMTTFTVPARGDDGLWRAHGTRLASCD